LCCGGLQDAGVAWTARWLERHESRIPQDHDICGSEGVKALMDGIWRHKANVVHRRSEVPDPPEDIGSDISHHSFGHELVQYTWF
jgi:hypothetical protein